MASVLKQTFQAKRPYQTSVRVLSVAPRLACSRKFVASSTVPGFRTFHIGNPLLQSKRQFSQSKNQFIQSKNHSTNQRFFQFKNQSTNHQFIQSKNQSTNHQFIQSKNQSTNHQFIQSKNQFTQSKNQFTQSKNQFTQSKNQFTQSKNQPTNHQFTQPKNQFTEIERKFHQSKKQLLQHGRTSLFETTSIHSKKELLPRSQKAGLALWQLHSGQGASLFAAFQKNPAVYFSAQRALHTSAPFPSQPLISSWQGLGGWLAVILALILTALPQSSAEEKEKSEAIKKKKLRTQFLKESLQQTVSQSFDHPPIYRIALTGGPCAGKSTALSHIASELTSLGFKVFLVPEAATIVVTGGGMWTPYGNFSPEQSLSFEGALMKTKLALEEAFMDIARSTNQPCVLLCDRGTMDTAAYLSRESWEVLLSEYGWNVIDMRDRRYDCVIHMVSAAIGAEQFYTTENNAARTETIPEARALDFKILSSWVGHPNIRIVDNSTGFNEKINRTVEHILHALGLPKKSGLQRKFLLDGNSFQFPSDVKLESFDVEINYLTKPEGTEGYSFIRRRGQHGAYAYTHSFVHYIPDIDEFTVQEHIISGREYVALLSQKDPNIPTLNKKVTTFSHEGQYYELNQHGEMALLKTSSPSATVPDWLRVKTEVSGNKEYSSYILAQKK